MSIQKKYIRYKDQKTGCLQLGPQQARIEDVKGSFVMGRNRKFDEREVLFQAMDVFWRRGFEGASISEICEKTGLNPGSLYALHGNKRDLFVAAMRQYLDDVLEDGKSWIAANPSGVGGIRNYFENVSLAIVCGKRRWGCLGTNAFMELGAKDPEVQDIMTAHFERLYGSFREALERDGAEDSEGTARYLVCVAQGMNVLARTGPDKEALDTIIRMTFSSLPSHALEATG
jgi:TetR/AcrR family transcriptional repressor of nem operon